MTMPSLGNAEMHNLMRIVYWLPILFSLQTAESETPSVINAATTAEPGRSQAASINGTHESKILRIWDFSSGNTLGWHHNREWEQVKNAGPFLRLRADDSPNARIPGGGMSLQSPNFSKPAFVSAGDGIEAILKTSRTGWVTLYYAEMREESKGSFGPERSERRLLYRSEDFQTFRILPRWNDRARIYKLRFDGPNFGGVLDIQSIRLVHPANTLPTPHDDEWDFRRKETASTVIGNQPPPNLQSTVEGLQVAGNDGPGLVTIDTCNVNADAKPWMRIRMRTNEGPMAGIAFHPTNRGTDEATRRYWAGREFIKWFHFNIRPDDRVHTYNIRLSDYDYSTRTPDRWRIRKRTGFEGTQRVFHLVPSHNPNAASCVESLSFGAEPEGPVCLVAEYAGPAESVLRIGRTGAIAVRLRNSGGKSPADIRISRVDKNESISIDTGAVRGMPDRLDPDTTATLYLDITAVNRGLQNCTLEISCRTDSLTVPMTLEIEPSLDIAARSVPEPRPIRTNYHIGCYYFTGWSDLNHWPKIPPLAERRPALGYYDELSPEAADWDIKWAVEHGIDHFVILWYHYNGQQRTRFIEEALLKAKFLPHIKFCVMWCNTSNPWWKYTEEDFVEITDYWIQNYFPHKQYRRDAQGRPIAWMLEGWNLVQHFGKKKAAQLMQDADARAKSAGFPGIHWIACQHGGKHLFDDPTNLKEVGFEEWTAYTINGLQTYPYPIIPAKTVTDSAPTVWNNIPVKPILPVFCGWNSRWVGRDFTFSYGFTPQLFAEHLAEVRDHMDKTGNDSIIIDCWNEWGEGEVLGPNAEYGFRLLKQVPKVFAPEETPRPVIVPEDVDMQVPEIRGLWQRVHRPPRAGP